MFTVLAKLPHLGKKKKYAFTTSDLAIKFADKLQALGIPASLGYERQLLLN